MVILIAVSGRSAQLSAHIIHCLTAEYGCPLCVCLKAASFSMKCLLVLLITSDVAFFSLNFSFIRNIINYPERGDISLYDVIAEFILSTSQ